MFGMEDWTQIKAYLNGLLQGDRHKLDQIMREVRMDDLIRRVGLEARQEEADKRDSRLVEMDLPE